MSDSSFWDKEAKRYAARPVADVAAYEYTLERTASHLRDTDAVLETGCGTGTTALKLAPYAGQITATDYSSGMIAQAQAKDGADNVTFKVAEVFDPAFQPEQFDAVLNFNLMHLVRGLPEYMDRIAELVKPGGLFISKTPCLADPGTALKLRLLLKVVPIMQFFGKAPFVNSFTIAQLQNMVEQRGFEIIETGNYPAASSSHFMVARKRK